MNVGQKIKEARIRKGLTQQELGDLLGVQKSAIAKYENGRVVNIKRSTLKKMSDILGLRPSELIFESNPEDAAELHAKIIMDHDAMDMMEKYYSLPQEEQAMVRKFISALCSQ